MIVSVPIQERLSNSFTRREQIVGCRLDSRMREAETFGRVACGTSIVIEHENTVIVVEVRVMYIDCAWQRCGVRTRHTFLGAEERRIL